MSRTIQFHRCSTKANKHKKYEEGRKIKMIRELPLGNQIETKTPFIKHFHINSSRLNKFVEFKQKRVFLTLALLDKVDPC